MLYQVVAITCPKVILGKLNMLELNTPLQKPFKTSDLVTAVYELLEKEKVS